MHDLVVVLGPSETESPSEEQVDEPDVALNFASDFLKDEVVDQGLSDALNQRIFNSITSFFFKF